METFKKAFVTLAVLAMVAGGSAVTGAAYAGHGHERGKCATRAQSRNDRYAQWRRHRAEHWRQMAKALGLSREQRSQVRDIFGRNRDEAAPARKQLFAERRTMRELVQADAPDEAAIRAQAQKIAVVEGDLAVRRAKTFGEIKAVLTPEQRKKFRELREKRERKRNFLDGNPGELPEK